MIKAIRALLDGGAAQADTGAWKSRISGWREQFPLTYEQSEPGDALKPQFCLEQLRDNAPEGTILVSGVGQHQMWAPVLEVQRAVHVGQLRWPGHDGLLRAGRDRRQGRPSRPHGVGDRRRRVLPDDRAGARHRARRADPDQGRHPQQQLPRHGPPVAGDVLRRALLARCTCRPSVPDFVKWAEAMGCVGIRVDSPEEVEPAIEKANSINDRPVVVDFRVDAREKVFPMVPGRRLQRRPHRPRPARKHSGTSSDER